MQPANAWTYLKVNRALLASLDSQFDEIAQESSRLDQDCGGIDAKRPENDPCSPKKLFSFTRRFACLPQEERLLACKDDECKTAATQELAACEETSLGRLRNASHVNEFLQAREHAKKGCEWEEKQLHACTERKGANCLHAADKVIACKVKTFDPEPWREWNDCVLEVGRLQCKQQEAILRNVPVRREFSLYAKYFDVPIDHVRNDVMKQHGFVLRHLPPQKK